jgi:acyl carrier protein
MTPSDRTLGENVGNSGRVIPLDEAQIQAWLVARVASLVGQHAENIDLTMPFDRMGVDSFHAVELAGEVQRIFRQDVDPTLLYDYVTIQALAEYLARQLPSGPAVCESTTLNP